LPFFFVKRGLTLLFSLPLSHRSIFLFGSAFRFSTLLLLPLKFLLPLCLLAPPLFFLPPCLFPLFFLDLLRGLPFLSLSPRLIHLSSLFFFLLASDFLLPLLLFPSGGFTPFFFCSASCGLALLFSALLRRYFLLFLPSGRFALFLYSSLLGRLTVGDLL
jgi:hypothetical protein